MHGEHAPSGRRWAGVSVGLLAAAGVVAVAALVRGEALANAVDDLVPFLLVAGIAAALGAWRLARAGELRALRAAESLRAALAERERELAAVREETRAELAEREDALERERAGVAAREEELERERTRSRELERARDVEREWIRELRAKLAAFREERGVLGDRRDVPALILRVAVALVGAEKGLLLLASHGESEDDLELAAAENFEHAADESAVARHFASQVLARDEMVRIDNVDELEIDERSEADEEIECLVAIPIYVRDRFTGAVVCANKPGGFDEDDDDVLLSLGDHAGALLENERLHGELRSSYLATVMMLAEAVAAKDPFLHGHSEDVSHYIEGVAEQLGFDAKRREELVFASLLHDVGKIGISERILLKPGALTAEERSVIEMHPRIGYRLLQLVPALREIAPAVLHHHERYDGTGYPTGLRGEQIPLEARVIAVVDAFSAMTADRPYRNGRSLEDACRELERCAGTQFDPRVVRLFVEQVRRHTREAEKEPLLEQALTDPEIEARRSSEEPLLGFGSFAVTDNLTLLYSHRHFCELVNAEAERAAVQAKPFAIVLAEVADIADVNRERGFAAGDEAIRTLARAVQLVGARVGGTACRFSGATIGLVAGVTSEREADELGEAILRELGNGTKVRLGIAVWRTGESGEDVLSRARAASRDRALVG